MMYARILGAPMYTAHGAKELGRLLERLKSKKLILIDTAGMGPRDVRLTEQLAALQVGAAKAQVLLTLPAQAEAHALDEIVKSFARISPAASILTKVDEAASLGAVLSAALRHKLKIAYVCDGQRVPEDLHAAGWSKRRGSSSSRRPRRSARATWRATSDGCQPMRDTRLSNHQAETLMQINSTRPVKVIAVTGGKGGVGKTTVSANLAVSMAAQGRDVMLVDADFGLVLGLHTRFHLGHVVNGDCMLEDAIVTGPRGLQIVPAASGTKRMANLSDAEQAGIIRAFSDLYHRVDTLVVDTAAGLHDSVLTFSQAAHHVIVVVCDEPASITDAYGLIKVLSREHGVQRFQILAN
jgi:Mrp family chromosome partitioning ATPase